MEEKERYSLMKKVPSAIFLHKQPVDVKKKKKMKECNSVEDAASSRVTVSDWLRDHLDGFTAQTELFSHFRFINVLQSY